MNYLTKFSLTEEQIKNIEKLFDERFHNHDVFLYEVEKVKTILGYFVDLGVNDLYDIIMTAPNMFYDTAISIKMRLDSYSNKEELSRLLNADPYNLLLVNLL